jgi:hypothetical protein
MTSPHWASRLAPTPENLSENWKEWSEAEDRTRCYERNERDAFNTDTGERCEPAARRWVPGRPKPWE